MRKLFYLIMLISILMSTTPVFAGHWFAHPFKDDFGDPTIKQYIKYDSNGSFRNYVTDSEKCWVKTKVSESGQVAFFIREYSSKYTVVQFDDGTIKMKNTAGEIIRVEATLSGRGIGVGGYEAEAIISFLKDAIGKVKVVILDQSHSRYRFDINANGFTASYNWIQTD